MRYIRLIVVYSLAFFSCFVLGLAKNTIEIKDTLIPHGKTYLIPVYGNINAAGSSKIKLSFVYDATILDISSIKGGSNTCFHEAAPKYDSTVVKWDSVYFDITSLDFDKTYNGILCFLNVEALVGKDSITKIKPVKLTLDDLTDNTAEFTYGSIKVGDPIVVQEYPEGIGYCTPNPNSWIARFDFNVQKNSKVTFKIYNTDGVLIQSIPEDNDKIKFDIFNAAFQKIPDPETRIYDKGAYRLYLDLSTYPVGAGNLYLLMQTDNGSYKTNFIYIK